MQFSELFDGAFWKTEERLAYKLIKNRKKYHGIEQNLLQIFDFHGA